MLTEILIHNAKIWRSGLKYSQNKTRLYSWLLFDSQSGRIKSCGFPGDQIPRGNLQALDLAGKWVFPGFHDAHIHTASHGQYLGKSQNLESPRSIGLLQEKVASLLALAANSAESGNPWFEAFGWELDMLGRYPTALDLDKVTTGRPVILYDVSVHIAVVNTMALQIGGFTKASREVEGGKIDRYPAGHELEGQPTGLLREHAIDILTALIPRSKDKVKKYIRSALQDCIEHGITTVHCLNENEWEASIELADENQLPIQCYLSLYYEGLSQNPRPKVGGETRGLLKCRCIKIFTDGALGSETAALSQPYVKKLPSGEDNYGVLLSSQEKLNEMVQTAHKQGFQLEIHVIGDRAAEIALNALEVNKIPPSSRPIFVHCQVLNQTLIKRIKDRGVVASVQPQFITTDSRWIRDRLPAELQSCIYPWRSMIEAGVICAGSSDSPVEFPNCLLGMYDAIFQPEGGREKGQRSFLPQECVTFEQAVDMYTADAAYLDFAEDSIGRLEPRFFANFVVLDVPVVNSEMVNLPQHPEYLLETKVSQTWARGVKLYDSSPN